MIIFSRRARSAAMRNGQAAIGGGQAAARKGGVGLILCGISAVGLGCHERPEAAPAVELRAQEQKRGSKDTPPAAPDIASSSIPPEVVELLARVNEDPEFACRRSYQQSVAALEHNPPHLENPELPRIEQASEEVYMADCRALPVTVQRCTVLEYAFVHLADCKQARAAHDAHNAAQHGGTIVN